MARKNIGFTNGKIFELEETDSGALLTHKEALKIKIENSSRILLAKSCLFYAG